MLFSSLADCPACRVQGAVVETWEARPAAPHGPHDSAHPGGAPGEPDPPVPSLSRCRMCGRTLEDGVEVRAPASLARLADVDAALARWAREEGCASADELVQSSFVLADVAKVHAALILGEPVETSFDVMGFLFSHGGGGTVGAQDDASDGPDGDLPLVDAGDVVWGPSASLRAVAERALEPRNELLALVSVAAADGRVVPAERAFLDAYARQKGVAPLAPDELRVFRADEVGPVGSLIDRERVLEKMIELAYVDATSSPVSGTVVDDSEERVIREFARAWRVDPARVSRWLREWHDEKGTLFSRLFRRAARHLLPEV